MSSTAIRAGSAYVELTIRDKITQGLRSAQAKLSTFANTARMIGTGLGMAAGIGTGVAAAIVGVSKVFADAGSEIHDMSQRTGVATEALSEFKYAAEQSGASLKDVEKAIRFMQKQGISADKFEATLIAVSQIADESQRAATAMKLWGKTGTMLLPMAGEIAQLRAEARTLGVSMTPQRASKADDLGDSFGRLKAAVMGLTMQLGAAFSPVIIHLVDLLTIAAVGIGKFADKIEIAVAGLELLARDNAGLIHSVLGGFGDWLINAPAEFRSQFPKRTTPDFGDLSSIMDMRGGSRGTFSGFRAENLGIGSGGGTAQKLDAIKGVLEKIKVGIDGVKDATEDIEGPEFG